MRPMWRLLPLVLSLIGVVLNPVLGAMTVEAWPAGLSDEESDDSALVGDDHAADCAPRPTVVRTRVVIGVVAPAEAPVLLVDSSRLSARAPPSPPILTAA